MSRKSLIKPIPPDRQDKRDWRVFVDGKLVEQVSILTMEHPRLGTLTYGATPLGYDSWSFHEHGGGGSVTLPFIVANDVVFVGVVRQLRSNQGGKVWNAPRGFLDPSEERAQGAAREVTEEFGLLGQMALVFPLPGQPGNPNSAFFETWAEGEGVSFFGLKIDAALTEPAENGFRFKPGVLDQSPAGQQERITEMIGEALFIPWFEAARLGDLFTNAAVARLLALLHEEGQSIG